MFVRANTSVVVLAPKNKNSTSTASLVYLAPFRRPFHRRMLFLAISYYFHQYCIIPTNMTVLASVSTSASTIEVCFVLSKALPARWKIAIYKKGDGQ